MSNPDFKYLERFGFDSGRISRRYKAILRFAQEFLKLERIDRTVDINRKLLKTAIYDYFVDVARLKEFHETSKINLEKVHGYMAYWLLKRKPLQSASLHDGSEFVNEIFVTAFIVSSVLREKGINTSKRAPSKSFHDFQSLLCYNLKYRPLSQQSLELMIEAFFCGCDFAAKE